MPTLALLALIAGVLPLHAATRPRPILLTNGSLSRRPVHSAERLTTLLMARTDDLDRPPARPFRSPFASSDPLSRHRAVTGINAHVRWYQRVGSLVGIAALVTFMGVLLAASIGVLFFAARILLELAIG